MNMGERRRGIVSFVYSFLFFFCLSVENVTTWDEKNEMHKADGYTAL